MKTLNLVLLAFLLPIFIWAQDDKKEGEKEKKDPYEFTVIKDNDCTPVENQYRSGTCWSFSSNSFFESEMIRLGKKPVDMSEMYIVRQCYADKAEKYCP